MKRFDFDRVIDRRNTACRKWVFMPQYAARAIPIQMPRRDGFGGRRPWT